MNKIEKIAVLIARDYRNGALVENVVVDDEFGCVTATINGRKNCDCGFIEKYERRILLGEPTDSDQLLPSESPKTSVPRI
jgi:hypothetical protein